MSAHDDSSFSARLWVQAEPYINRWPVRACGRAVAGSFPVGALVGALSDVPDELPGSSDRIMDLAFAGAAALFLVLWLLLDRSEPRRHRLRDQAERHILYVLVIAAGYSLHRMARRGHGRHAT